jgi:dihydroneopterin aldolase
MSISDIENYKSVLNIIQGWSQEQRVSLVQDVLKTLSNEMKTDEPKETLKKALSLLNPVIPAPSDSEIKEWLEEHRMEKYG